jgi:ADP-heptose:LPS heptosyltransferase
MVNRSSRALTGLLTQSCVDKVIEFDRDEIQHGLVQVDRPLFEPFDRAKAFLEEVNKTQYDLVVNLTQNKLSARLMGLIDSKDKMGLLIDAQAQTHYHSPWFKFLNDVVEAGAQSVFHYSDIYYYGLGLARGEQAFALNETATGQAELQEFLRLNGFQSGPKIVIQALTSDTKKNWGDAHWCQALHQLQILEPSAQFILLGAPNEKHTLEQLQVQLNEKKIKTTVAILSLEGAYSLLQLADLLITGDTSIKHLAASAGTPMVELALGSSHLHKTGAYLKNTLILTSAESCSPCGHRELCHREKHFCGQSLAPEAVALAASKRLHNDWPAIQTLAAEFESDIRFYRTQFLLAGFWYAEDVRFSGETQSLSHYLNMAAWHFYLQNEHMQPLAAYGSESLTLRRQLELMNHRPSLDSLNILLNQIEIHSLRNEARLDRVMSQLQRFVRQTGRADDSFGMKEEIAILETDLQLGRYLSEKLTGPAESGFYNFRQLQTSLTTAHKHQQIKIKLLRSLKSQMKEIQ